MRLAALAFAIAAVTAGDALAKPPASSPRGVRVEAAPSVDNVFWMVDCLIDRKDRDLEKVLSTVPGSKGSEIHWLLAAIGDCLVEGRPIPAASFYKRGAVAERFLYRDFAAIGSSPRRKPAPVFAPVGRDYLAEAEPHSVSTLMLLDTASCVVRRDPQRAYGFFGLRKGSVEERAMMLEMARDLSACFTKDQPLRLTPAIFRAFLAEAAYRVAAGEPDVFQEDS